jgi:internalin A
LTNLKTLCLCDNQISDISVLSGLTKLTELRLSNNQISDVSALSNLTNVNIWLSDNQISDISALSVLTKVSLRLSNNQISDISALAELTELYRLDLRGNPLNTAAYCVYLPLIGSSNPNLTRLTYDPNPNPLTEDDIASLIDFAELALNWLETGCGEQNSWCDGADLNHTGYVDLDDLAEFLNYLHKETEE